MGRPNGTGAAADCGHRVITVEVGVEGRSALVPFALARPREYLHVQQPKTLHETPASGRGTASRPGESAAQLRGRVVGRIVERSYGATSRAFIADCPLTQIRSSFGKLANVCFFLEATPGIEPG